MIFISFSMSVATNLRSLYCAIRPHHALLLYSSLPLLRRILTRLTSQLSTLLIPMLYSKYGSVFLTDGMIRCAIRARCRHTLLALDAGNDNDNCNEKDTLTFEMEPRTKNSSLEQSHRSKLAILSELSDPSTPIAIDTTLANQQHYEVPEKFYQLCLGKHRKYSCGLWRDLVANSSNYNSSHTLDPLEQSEVDMLNLYLHRAQVQDGMKIIDLGCGWGSLTLHLAKTFPNVHILGISNSHSQRDYILSQALERGYNTNSDNSEESEKNRIRIITCDVAKWDDPQYVTQMLPGVVNYDRVISIEMFEHMKNYSALLQTIHTFLKPHTGKLFLHIFSHKYYAYHFSSSSDNRNWMANTFFTGGTMPSNDLLLYFSQHFAIQKHWIVNGRHYQKTSNAWLSLLDKNWKNGTLEPVLEEAYGRGRAREWYVNWRLFYLAVAELFGMNGGEEWIVSHYLLEKRE